MKKILIVDSNSYERKERAQISIECRSMGTLGHLKAENPADAIVQLQIEDGIVGVISALNFPGTAGLADDVVQLNRECQTLDIPFWVCISRADDKPSLSQLEMLTKNGIEYDISEGDNRKNWAKLVGAVIDSTR